MKKNKKSSKKKNSTPSSAADSSADEATPAPPPTNHPALDEPNAMEVIQKDVPTTAPAVSTDRKQQLLSLARNERRKWVQRVPLPYKSARDPNNLWSLEDRLYPVQSSLACQKAPTTTKVLSDLYGLEANIRSPEQVAQRVQDVIQPFLDKDTSAILEPDPEQLSKAMASGGTGNDTILVQAYRDFWTTLLKPECALLVQGMRNFLGNLEEDLTMDRLSVALKSYLDATTETLKTHVAWQNKHSQADSETKEFDLVKRSLESFVYGQAQPLLDKLEWTGLFTSSEEEWTKRIGQLQFVKPQHLEIKCLTTARADEISIDDLLTEPIQAMLSIDQYFSPYEKLQRILAVFQGVNAALATALNTGNSGERVLPSADDVLPTIILTVLRAKPTHIFRNLQLVELFSPQEYLRGEAGYAYTNLYGAVQFLHDLDLDKPDSLSISAEEFRKGLQESATKAQKRITFIKGDTEVDDGPTISTEISIQDVREARLKGEQVNLEWAIRHQKEHPEKYASQGKQGEVLAPLPDGFKRSYAFMTTTPQDIRMSDLPQLLSEYKMLVHVTEQLLGERGSRLAMERKKKQNERNKQLDDSFWGIAGDESFNNNTNSRERALTS